MVEKTDAKSIDLYAELSSPVSSARSSYARLDFHDYVVSKSNFPMITAITVRLIPTLRC